MIQSTTEPAATTGPMPGTIKNARTDEHTPEPAPKCAPFAPVFHPVACVIEADDILFRLVVAADDSQLLDVKPTTLQLLDGVFCCRVLAVNCNDRVWSCLGVSFIGRLLILDSHWFRFVWLALVI